MSDQKRKSFTAEEYLLLLRQVAADAPFNSSRGNKMEKWDAVACKLQILETFGRACTGKGCYARFNTLLEKHKKFNERSARASGVDEEYDEKVQLLDEILVLYEDWQNGEATKKEDDKTKKENRDV